MRIGIVTHYDVHNHGAVLQLNALISLLRKKHISAYALTFEKDLSYIDPKLKNKYRITLKSIPYYINYALEKGVSQTLFNMRKRRILKEFKVTNDLIGGKFGDPKFDTIIIGSDEVFSTKVGISKEFFCIDSPYKKTFTYAASFGPTTFKDIIEKKEVDKLKNGLKNIRSFSVRDNNSKEILKYLGFDSIVVCDPVILYGYTQELSETVVKELPKYLLVYSYDNNMNDSDEVYAIKKFARNNGLKIVSAGFYHNWCDFNINCNPLELLKYISNAQAIITDTFHGTIMSIIANTPMMVKVRGNANKLSWLISEYELTDRVIYDFSEIDVLYKKPVDFSRVNQIVKHNREKALSWLMDEIENE